MAYRYHQYQSLRRGLDQLYPRTYRPYAKEIISEDPDYPFPARIRDIGPLLDKFPLESQIRAAAIGLEMGLPLWESYQHFNFNRERMFPRQVMEAVRQYLRGELEREELVNLQSQLDEIASLLFGHLDYGEFSSLQTIYFATRNLIDSALSIEDPLRNRAPYATVANVVDAYYPPMSILEDPSGDTHAMLHEEIAHFLERWWSEVRRRMPIRDVVTAQVSGACVFGGTRDDALPPELSLETFDRRYVVPGCPQVVWDAREGAGATSYNTDVRYFGFGVVMKPSMFLRLAAPLHRDARKSETWSYLGSIAKERGWAPPQLYVQFNMEDEIVSIVGHEGRHRTTKFMEVCGDIPYLVHIAPRGFDPTMHFFLGGYEIRARHVTPEMLNLFHEGVEEERRSDDPPEWVAGPIFSKVYLQDREIDPTVGSKTVGSRSWQILNQPPPRLDAESWARIYSEELPPFVFLPGQLQIEQNLLFYIWSVFAEARVEGWGEVARRLMSLVAVDMAMYYVKQLPLDAEQRAAFSPVFEEIDKLIQIMYENPGIRGADSVPGFGDSSFWVAWNGVISNLFQARDRYMNSDRPNPVYYFAESALSKLVQLWDNAHVEESYGVWLLDSTILAALQAIAIANGAPYRTVYRPESTEVRFYRLVGSEQSQLMSYPIESLYTNSDERDEAISILKEILDIWWQEVKNVFAFREGVGVDLRLV